MLVLVARVATTGCQLMMPMGAGSSLAGGSELDEGRGRREKKEQVAIYVLMTGCCAMWWEVLLLYVFVCFSPKGLGEGSYFEYISLALTSWF